jgi:hypothetical protein
MPPSIEYYTDVSCEQAVELIVGLHHATGGLLASFTKSNYYIEVVALAMPEWHPDNAIPNRART